MFFCSDTNQRSIILGEERFEPRTAGCEALPLPLCFACLSNDEQSEKALFESLERAETKNRLWTDKGPTDVSGSVTF